MWLFAVWGIFHCTQEIIHIFDRLLKLDSFNKAGSNWLSGSEKTGDFYWKQYKLDLIERVFLNFSLIAIIAAVVTLLMMCLFRSEKPAIIWAATAPIVLIVFTATQGELFSCFIDRAMRKEMIMAILFQAALSAAVIVYSFIGRKIPGKYCVLAVIVTAGIALAITLKIGRLSIHRSESIGWIYANVFTALTAICISHIKKHPKQIKE